MDTYARFIAPGAPILLGLMCLAGASGGSLSNAIFAVASIVAAPLLLLPRFRRCPIVIAAVTWAALVLMIAAIAALNVGEGHQFEQAGKYLRLAIFPLVGILGLTADERRQWSMPDLCLAMLACAVVGFLIVLLRHAELAKGLRLFSAYTLHRGSLNRNEAALFAGLCLVSLAPLAAALCYDGRLSSLWRAALGAVVLALFILMAWALVEMRSRANWLAAAGSLTVWAAVMATAIVRARTTRLLIYLASIVAAGAILTALWFVVPAFKERFDEFSLTIYFEGVLGLFRGTIDAKYEGEIRVAIMAFGLDLISQRPWFGWGPDVSYFFARLGAEHPFRTFTQFHNGYLQFVVSFGLVGVVCSLALSGVVLRQLLGPRRDNGEPCAAPAPQRAALKAFALAALAYLAIVNFFETILFVKVAAYVFVVVLGMACAWTRFGYRSGVRDER